MQFYAFMLESDAWIYPASFLWLWPLMVDCFVGQGGAAYKNVQLTEMLALDMPCRVNVLQAF